MKNLFQKHFEQKFLEIKTIMDEEGMDRLLIESGMQEYHFLDDTPKSFKPNPHFLYLCPHMGQGHVIDIHINDDKPTLYFLQPNDFWHEVSSLQGSDWEECFNLKIFHSYDEIWNALGALNSQVSFIAPNPRKATERGCLEAGDVVLSKIHWTRIQKTDYEISCIEEANKQASLGHKAAEKAFFEGLSELEIYNTYLVATNQREQDLPYGSIVALNKNAAILHYQSPKMDPQGLTFLIDAGARFQGYCSDITRTYANEQSHPVFKGLLQGMEKVQRLSCDLVHPGTDYIDLHRQAHIKITELLIECDIIQTSLSNAITYELTHPFFPHGLGHPIGLQVHDVAGRQIHASGRQALQPEEFPHLRTLRSIQKNDVLTIEPGLYFIPMLLNNLKSDSKRSSFLNWTLINELIPMGGIRIEDNVVATHDGPRNLTRLYLP